MTTMTSTKRLLVTRQHPETRRFARVGELSLADEGHYVFQYDIETTRPLPGLPLTESRIHRSQELWPVFAERVMRPERPDYRDSLERLGLDLAAVPFEVLAVSGGRRTGDAYELTPIPQPGPVELPFLVHGVRHLHAEEIEAVDALSVGQRLHLEPEQDNPVNERALLVTKDGTRLGYVPDALVEYVHDIKQSDYDLQVKLVNPPSAGYHMRLLVALRGVYSGCIEQ